MNASSKLARRSALLFDALLAALARVSGPDKQGWYTALCPFHNDRNRPNLRFREKGFKCLACGEKGSLRRLAEKIGLEPPEASERSARIVDTYDYCDERSSLLFQVVRYHPKSFKQRRPDGKGGWLWNLNGVRRVLYRLPELLSCPGGEPVFLVEGEKDVEAIRSLRLTATCNPGGAGKFTPDMKQPLRGKRVIIVADKDEPGRRHATQVRELLRGFAASVQLIELPGDQVKDAADWVATGGTREKLMAIIDPPLLPANTAGSDVLDNIVRFIRRFVVITEEQAIAVALWVTHAHCFDKADATPYLHIHSSEKRSGKTRLLEVLELLVPRAWFTGHVTAAALVRKVDAECPTLLLDESDAAFNADKEYTETLRGILNSGYRRGGKVTVCVGQGASISYKDFSTFSPKAIAGIGRLPGTIADRSIPITLKRRSPEESVERFRRRYVEEEAQQLFDSIATWRQSAQISAIADNIPLALDDRAADCWEPLLAIADAAGNQWPQKARRAAIALMNGTERNEDSIGIQLLADIRDIFGQLFSIDSANLVERLCRVEDGPWVDLRGRPLTQRSLATLLRPYGITPQNMRINNSVQRGYKREQFNDAWQRYLPQGGERSATSATSGTADTQNNLSEDPLQSVEHTPIVEDGIHAQSGFGVADVADRKPVKRDETQQENEKWVIEI